MKSWGNPNRKSRFSSTIELKRIAELLRFSVPLSVMSVVLTGLGASSGWNILLAVGSLPLYIVVLFLPRVPSLVAVIVYSASLLSPYVPRTHIVRVLICAGALAAGNARLGTIPPILLFIFGWGIYLLIGYIPALHLIHEIPTEASVTLFIVESLSVIIASFLRMTTRFPGLVGGKTAPFTLLSFLTHLLTLATVGTMLLVIETFHYTQGTELIAALQTAITRPATLIALLAGLFLLPFACSVILTKATGKALNYLQLTVSPESRLLLSLQDPIPISEIQETHRNIRDHFTNLGTELRQSQALTRDLQKDAEEKEVELRERELSATNLERLMDLAPWGMVSCSANGLVISANEEFCKIVGVANRDKIRGLHLSAIELRNTWGKELISVLMWALRDWKQLVQRDLIRHYSSARRNSYLEIFVKIAVAAHLPPDVDVQTLRTSDIAITLYVRKHPDLRDFQLRLLSPSAYEVLGTQVADIGKMLRGQFTAIVGHLSVATEIVNRASGQNASAIADPKLIASMREIEKISRQASRDLQELEDKVTPPRRQTTRIDLHAQLQFGLNYLYELLAQDDRIQVTLEVADADPTLPDRKGSVHITTNEEEATRFFCYFLYFVQQLMTRAPEIDISVGYEAISAEAAAMLTGSHAGHYARIILHHAGQSLTANMMTGKFHRIDALSQAGSQLEIALSLLYAQTAQLSGFISAQSTATKGTTITVYLPVERAALEEVAIAAKSRKHFKRKSFNEEASITQNVLVVGTESEILSTLQHMLQHLGYNIQTKDPREVVAINEDDITFSGSGFGLTEEDSLVSDELNSIREDKLLTYDLLILNIEQGPHAALPLLHTLEKQNADAATLLVVDNSNEVQKMFSDWTMLKKPFDLDTLSHAIRAALARA